MGARTGEDQELKHLAWVVENLQEELIRANAARCAADADVVSLQGHVEALQVWHCTALHCICDITLQSKSLPHGVASQAVCQYSISHEGACLLHQDLCCCRPACTDAAPAVCLECSECCRALTAPNLINRGTDGVS